MRKRKKNRLFTAIVNGILVALAAFVVGVIFVNYFFGIELVRPYVVQSGSMEPAIKTGSVVLSLPLPTYSPGDVITFAPKGNGETLITHRVEFKLYPENDLNNPLYLTSGDANEDFDRWEVLPANIVGKVILSVPYLGYAVNFAKQPYGFLLLVIIPATIIIYEELKMLLRESILLLRRVNEEVDIRRFLPKRKINTKPGGINREKVEVVEKTISLTPKIRPSTLQRASILIPVFGAALIITSISASFFFDNEISTDNILAAAESFNNNQENGPSTAQTLVINEFLWDSSCTPNPETKFWLELYNGFDVQTNIKDWQFKDGNDNLIQITNANFFIDPGEYVLITKSNSTFSQQCYENEGDVVVLNLGGNPDFTPTTTGGIIKLEKPDNGGFEVVDRIEYGPDQNGGVLDTSIDESITRTPNALDTALGDTFEESDFAVENDPTPGLPTP